jgi:hypothetical protein
MVKKGEDILASHKVRKLQFDPKLKQINLHDRRFYKDKSGEYYPSVTTILEYMPKDRFFIDYIKDVGHNSDIILRRASAEGTAVHEAAENLLKGDTIKWIDENGYARYNTLVWNMIVKFSQFWKKTNPELILCEELLHSNEHKYAGTVDLVVKIDGVIWLLDIKTSNYLHKVNHLQLAAYAKAVEELHGIKIEKTGIIWLKSKRRTESKKAGEFTGKGWELKEVNKIEENFEMFKLIHKLYNIENKEIKPNEKGYPTEIKL